jgi:DNA-binding MarR family transcriptional regulator
VSATTAARELADALNELMLPRSRAELCAPAIAVAPELEAQSYFLLSTLARTGPAAPTRLAALIGIDRSGTSRYADRLVRAGLVERRPDPDDRRASLLALSPEGARLAERMNEALAGRLRELTEGWTAAETEALVEGIARLLAATPPE